MWLRSGVAVANIQSLLNAAGVAIKRKKKRKKKESKWLKFL